MICDDLFHFARSLGKRDRRDYAVSHGKAPCEVGSVVFGPDADYFWAHVWKLLQEQGAKDEDFNPLLIAWREAFMATPPED